VSLTTHRLVRRPAYIERLFRSQEWACSLDDVVRIEVGPRFTSPIGALGQLVPVNLTGGRVVMFRVWNGSRFAARVTAAKPNVTPPGDGPRTGNHGDPHKDSPTIPACTPQDSVIRRASSGRPGANPTA
jgi:hypothetical protein